MVKKAISLHVVYILDMVRQLSIDDGGMQQPACVAAAVAAARAHFRDQSICCKVRTYHFWLLNEAAIRIEAQGGPRQPRVVRSIKNKSRSTTPQGRVAAARSIGMAIGSFVFVAMALCESVQFEGRLPTTLATTVALGAFGLQRATSNKETAWRMFDCLYTSLLYTFVLQHGASDLDDILGSARTLRERVAALRQLLATEVASFKHAKYWYQNASHLSSHLKSVSSAPSSADKSFRAGGFLEIQAFCKVFHVSVTVIERCAFSAQLTQDVFELEGGFFWLRRTPNATLLTCET